MAVKDVRQYYTTLVKQRVELENDLLDFEQALKDGYITEDRLEEVKNEKQALKINEDRVAYIIYLLEQPNRKQNKDKYKKANSDCEQYFKLINADQQSVYDENKSIIKRIKTEVEKIKQEIESEK